MKFLLNMTVWFRLDRWIWGSIRHVMLRRASAPIDINVYIKIRISWFVYEDQAEFIRIIQIAAVETDTDQWQRYLSWACANVNCFFPGISSIAPASGIAKRAFRWSSNGYHYGQWSTAVGSNMLWTYATNCADLLLSGIFTDGLKILVSYTLKKSGGCLYPPQI